MEKMPLKNYTIRKCIYCGAVNDKLSREHVIPFGLNGEIVLQKASCDDCAKLTSQFERNVLKGQLQQIRAGLGLKTRRIHPKTFPTTMEIAGEKRSVDLPVEEYGAMTILPTFRMPAFLDNRESLHGTLDILGVIMLRITGPDISILHKKYNAKSIDFRVDFNPGDYIKLLTKIAYGYAVLVYGVDAFEDNYALAIILGNTDEIDKWVGSEPSTIGNEDIFINLEKSGRKIIAKIRLFGTRKVPTYIVVVGTLKE